MKIIIYKISWRVLRPFTSWTWLIITCIVCSACGEIDDPSALQPPGQQGGDPPPGASDDLDPLQGVHTENWGIGDRWYDYTFDTHAVAPSNISWVMIRKDDAYHFRILRYYGDDGASGKPTMVVRPWTGDGFGSEQTIKIETSIRTEPACIRLDTAAVVPCNADERFDIVWRTDRRPIPEEGFAISNPALYATGDGGARVLQYRGKTPPDTLPDLEHTVPREVCEPIGSDQDMDAVAPDPRCDTLPWRIYSVFDEDDETSVSFEDLQTRDVWQMTGTMHIAQWRAEIDEPRENLTIWARCMSADFTAACTPPLDSPPKSITFALAELAPWTFIDLCGPKGTPAVYPPRIYEQRDTLRAGLWASNEEFELAIQRTDHDILLRMAPSQPFELAEHQGFAEAQAPRGLWSIPGPTRCNF